MYSWFYSSFLLGSYTTMVVLVLMSAAVMGLYWQLTGRALPEDAYAAARGSDQRPSHRTRNNANTLNTAADNTDTTAVSQSNSRLVFDSDQGIYVFRRELAADGAGPLPAHLRSVSAEELNAYVLQEDEQAESTPTPAPLPSAVAGVLAELSPDDAADVRQAFAREAAAAAAAAGRESGSNGGTLRHRGGSSNF